MEMNYDEAVLHEIEHELHTEIYPGTEIMTDVGAHHFVKSSDHSDQVLVPQPSADPKDPLNWSKWWKFSTMACATSLSFSQGFGPLALAPMFPQLIEAFDTDIDGVVQFTGVCILVLGFSNFIWVPISTTFGRRPAFLISMLISLVSNIWRARAQTYGSFMGACILNGIGAGTAETLQPTVIADIIFLHERGAYNTLYFTFYFGSLMVGPIISGAMADHIGWRNFWWLNVALLGVIILAAFFGFPETKWHRLHPNEIVEQQRGVSPASADKGESNQSIECVTDHKVNIGSKGEEELAQVLTAEDPFLRKGAPSRQQFALAQKNTNALQGIIRDLWIPFMLFAFPIVDFAAFAIAFSAGSFLIINLTQSQIFAAPPYDFSSQSIGFMNFATLVGSLIGLATNGPLSDWISARQTRRNRGVREPEMRLPAVIPYVIIMIIGNFVVGYGYQQKWPWQVIVIIGYTSAGIQVAALPAIISTYAVDSYKPATGSVFVAITVVKNIWGYGMGKFLTPWILKAGFLHPVLTNMALITFFYLLAIIFFFLGKKMRGWTKNSIVHSM